jgi:hypothetical protein
MKRTIVVVAALLAVAAAASAQFEGTVKMRTVTYEGADSNVIAPTVYFKGPLFAAVVPAQPGQEAQAGRFILRGDKNVMWIILDQDKKYIEITVAKPGGKTDSARAAMKKAYTLTKTGRTRTIIGYPCEEWAADEGGGVTSEVWATGKLGNIYEGVVKWFDGMSMESATDRTRWEREIAEMKLFPLLVLRSEEGEVVEREEVVSVQKGKVPDKVFAAPAGYQKQSVDLNFDKLIQDMMKDTAGQGKADSTGGSPR